MDLTRIDDPAFKEVKQLISNPRAITITLTEDRGGNHDVIISCAGKERFAFKVVTRERKRLNDSFTMRMVSLALCELFDKEDGF